MYWILVAFWYSWQFAALSKAQQSCIDWAGHSAGEFLKQTGAHRSLYPRPAGHELHCKCSKTCHFQQVRVISSNCSVLAEACDENSCKDSRFCDQPRCNTTSDATYHTDEHHCKINTKPCHCCVQPLDFWQDQCKTGPFYNSSACGRLCELCLDICGSSVCEWLKGSNGQPPQVIKNMQLILALWLNFQHPDPCVPALIEQIWLTWAPVVLVQSKCAFLLFDEFTIKTLEGYLNGRFLNAPLCPC